MTAELSLVFGLLCVALAVTRGLSASIDRRPIWPAMALGGIGIALLAMAWQADPDGVQVADVPVAIVKLFRAVVD